MDTQDAAITILKDQLQALSEIFQEAKRTRDYRGGSERLARWKSRTVKLISEHINPNEGKKLEDKRLGTIIMGDHRGNLRKEADLYRAFLEALMEDLTKYPRDISPGRKSKKTELQQKGTVFIVHGHDEYAKESVARLLAQLELKPIILHEQPDRGQTIIEKLEASSSEVDIDYAIIILTPDDVGARASEEDKFQPRARQNVVFELGYFIGKLGRARVRALYTEGIELPSDYQGVLYTKWDAAGAWRLELAREIEAAGIDIDLNRLT